MASQSQNQSQQKSTIVAEVGWQFVTQLVFSFIYIYMHFKLTFLSDIITTSTLSLIVYIAFIIRIRLSFMVLKMVMKERVLVNLLVLLVLIVLFLCLSSFCRKSMIE